MYYFVNSETGDNGQAGGFDAPFKTIQKGLDVAGPSDVVYVRQGVYQEHAVFPISGQAGAPIKLAGYIGELPVLEGSSIALPREDGLLQAVAKNYLELENLQVSNAERHGVSLRDCSFLDVIGIKTKRTAHSGIWAKDSNDLTVARCDVDEACFEGNQPALALANVDTFSVFESRVTRSGTEGISIYAGSSGGKVYRTVVSDCAKILLYVDGYNQGCSDIELFLNMLFTTPKVGFSIASEKGGAVSDVSFHHSLIFNCGLTGVWVADWPANKPHPMDGLDIWRNVIIKNGWASDWDGGGIQSTNPDAVNVSIRENAVIQNAAFQIALRKKAQAQVDDNVIDGFRGAMGEIMGNNPITPSTELLVALGSDLRGLLD